MIITDEVRKKLTVWHISDTHSYHNLLTIPDNIDIVIHSGDCSNYKDLEKNYQEYLQRLNGNKFFINGNHDNKDTICLYKKYGTFLGNLYEVNINYQNIVLCHYAMRVWRGSHKGTWHLYGHSHGSLPDLKDSLSFDVGINCHNYYPLEFKDVLKIIKSKEYKPIDHHK